MCIAMWREKSSSPLHLLHFGFGIGAVLAPQLARPFIGESPSILLLFKIVSIC